MLVMGMVLRSWAPELAPMASTRLQIHIARGVSFSSISSGYEYQPTATMAASRPKSPDEREMGLAACRCYMPLSWEWEIPVKKERPAAAFCALAMAPTSPANTPLPSAGLECVWIHSGQLTETVQSRPRASSMNANTEVSLEPEAKTDVKKCCVYTP